ncbi:MAG TPA: 16S rRNA (adenine(1518)-N(6)/adenine(1519)-N(6))-dimethyltransferase RsmA [Anaerolineales bacterium]
MNDIPRIHSAQLLKQHGLWATRRLGQNFLEEPAALQQIAEAAGIQSSDTVLEVGPGLGNLTRYLSVSSHQVVAVELDRRLIPVLEGVLKPYRNVRLILGDILALSPRELGLPERYLAVANIPYNITSALLRHLLASQPEPRRTVLTIQKEVAERICSQPPDMSLLALSVQVYGRPSIVAAIPAESFFPTPRVDSAVIRIEIYPDPLIERGLLQPFFELIKAGFSQKRKTMRNALAAGLRISPAQATTLLVEAGLDPQRRAETLSIEEWRGLVRIRRPQ